MSKLSKIRKMGFDVETTGVSVTEDRIVTASLIFTGGGEMDAPHDYLINPEIPIPIGASEIHGIYDADVRARGSAAKVALEDIASRIATGFRAGYPLIGYNVSFDYSMLHWELVRCGLPTLVERLGRKPHAIIDPYVIDKEIDRYRRGKRKLQNVAEHYGVVTGDYEWHSASADVKATVGIAEVLFDRYQFLDRMGFNGLYGFQKMWRERQSKSLQEYFRNPAKSGDSYNPEAVVNGEWPLIGGKDDEI
ncbi:exonuclease domain-containing protein [Streptomyces sp. ME02-8801-2C]|uniref:exonuclease domain-containing protein n=1 Tax=Streptomyces sp. ME02-8801-2C TaxID=3028680 RepID=UPI0029BCB844|nr:exonuclease domain-containing protein [Streptomyces sp. ME02-8801-2C]MDX3458953.1 exonuclease domain-containing protein [Streptomyces sp. ME02-8801-2C]